MAWRMETAWSKSVPPRRMPWLAVMAMPSPSLRKTVKSEVPPPMSTMSPIPPVPSAMRLASAAASGSNIISTLSKPAAR